MLGAEQIEMSDDVEIGRKASSAAPASSAVIRVSVGLAPPESKVGKIERRAHVAVIEGDALLDRPVVVEAMRQRQSGENRLRMIGRGLAIVDVARNCL